MNFAFPTSDLKPTGLFSDIRFGTMGQNSARIVLTAKKPVQVTVAETKKADDGQSFRFVLDAEITTKGKFAEPGEGSAMAGARPGDDCRDHA